MLADLFAIWLVIMIVAGIAKAAGNRKKRQTILDQQYKEALEKQRPKPWGGDAG